MFSRGKRKREKERKTHHFLFFTSLYSLLPSFVRPGERRKKKKKE